MDKDFFRRDAITLSRDLLGKYLVRKYEGQQIITKIVETEAYMGIEDKAAHVFNDKRTSRTEPLYQDGGCIYVYLIYGMYHCLNISANIEGVPQCVLIRAVEPVSPMNLISQNRYLKNYDELSSYQKKNICNGPGKLCKALKIDKELNFKSILGDELYILDNDEEIKKSDIIESKRVNIDYAQEAKDYLWRFYIKDNKHISKK
ncbi:DNA-3-methyladenine glycosylase [Paraclostridium sordellii]|uniref:Putative 3-methyladenine DNA glycosylase n=1 Tax=Paraclostridium sordellii TaxID=1505 RepID=A0A0C7IDH6_PARSO|nr:DNA-3-methyladenine glycosylase [Paeniclostridium sordellii]QYE98414.1 DNA-3-methyladenine glycosylase [Paeniclostridium sordellii]CEN77401.1 3-methyladenine DNA glycosylase [[Clostridium] sordellii] [Paeniclostridium sordellii]CEO10728.1 3-methyladenine DNA glycosylase [[Clostridium] sordellii] [Paeniclostridium sordellii]CEP41983.1 3-methyladenine DNA glycosylase [[Clostridium] sordellii] [Paeniclostridium sordellii]CEP85963.1 3-methyladenine DNA glycosylase [[Clostridium] sordellii] [Pae